MMLLHSGESEIIAFFVHIWRTPDGQIVHHRVESLDLDNNLVLLEGAQLDLLPRIKDVMGYEKIDARHTKPAMKRTNTWRLYKRIDREFRSAYGQQVARTTTIWVTPNDPRQP